jgi:phosphoribosylcarboxyaminoimidazole (NCAIR) mutase
MPAFLFVGIPLFAAAMLSTEFPAIRARLLDFRRAQTDTVLVATLPEDQS